MDKFDMVAYIKNVGGAVKLIYENIEKILNRLDVLDIEIKQLKENDNIQNKKLDKLITSYEKRKAGVIVNNNVDIDLTDRQIAGKCKYSDEQLYAMHYNVGGKFKKQYSYNDLVKLTGMSLSYVKDHIREYKKLMNMEV